MQDMKTKVREIGAALQLSPEYVRYVAAQEANEADDALNKQMQALELLRLQYQHEAAKQDAADEDLMEEYDQQFQALYDEIMDNAHMREYRAASEALTGLLKWTSGYLQGCAQGEDPALYDPEQASGCSGSCSGCSGCG